MAEKKKLPPLLMNELTLPEKVSLAHMLSHPGFGVFKKMIEALCSEATQAVAQLDPEDTNYDGALLARAQNMRTVNATCARLVNSVNWHIEHSEKVEQEARMEAELMAKKEQLV